jgi:hypothetical protein
MESEKIKELIKYIMDELFQVIIEEDACYQGYGFPYDDFINEHYEEVSKRIKEINNVRNRAN